jgi:RNA-directed DNA polymerase
MSGTAEVPVEAKQAEFTPTPGDWVDRTVWTERLLAALGNGVKGNKGFSLIDKVYRPSTLQGAWEQVKANRGAAGIDGQSIERFAAHAERYLNELAKDLEAVHYRPQAVLRVDIPKAGGKTRPLGIPPVKDQQFSFQTQVVVSGGLVGGCRRLSIRCHGGRDQGA